jgi:hypothetical protein
MRVAPRRLASLVARVALVASLSLSADLASAVDLGETTVRSSIGQPLNVEIELVSLKPGEDKSITAHLGSRQAHRKAGIDFNRSLAELRISVGRRAGRPVLRLRTTQPVNEAFVEAVIVLRSSAGTTTHRYTVFLEPPGRQTARSAQSKPPATKPKPGTPPSPAPPVAASALAEKPAPLSRDELFGLPAREDTRAAEAKPAPGSRDELFGVPAQEKAAAPQSRPLEWRGFVQNTTAYDYQDPKHWSRAVVRTQLGTQGGSGDFKWKASARLDVDPVYFNSGFYPEAVRNDQRANFMLRETYVDTSLGTLQLRLGKQHIIWGEMVGLFFADVVSARDQRDFILPDFDIMRIPQWAARVEYFGENSHAEIIWLPYPAVDNIGKPGAEFYPYRIPPPPGFDQQFNNVVGPERNLENSNFGLRVSTLQSGWDLSAFYYRSTDVNPTFYREVVLAPTPTLVFTPRHDRIWQAGGTVTKDFRSFVGKAEVVYTAGRKYNVTRLTEPEGVVPQDTLDYVFGLDFTLPHETRLNLQYFERMFFDHDPDLLQDEREGGVTLLINTKVAGSFTPELLIIQSLNRNDRLLRAKLGWSATQNLAFTVGVDVFTGPETGFFGRFNDRDRTYLEARYDF